MTNPTKLTPEIKEAINNLIDADQKLRYPEQQPLDSNENKRCRELGLTDNEGSFLPNLPDEISNYIDECL